MTGDGFPIFINHLLTVVGMSGDVDDGRGGGSGGGV